MLLLDASDLRHLPVLNRLAAFWTLNQDDSRRTWVVYVTSSGARRGVRAYFSDAPGESTDRDSLATWLEARLPLETAGVTEVSLVRADEGEPLIEVEADLPAPGELAAGCVEDFRLAGFDCRAKTRSDDLRFTEVQYATGEVGGEQVLGWDDIYSEALWSFLSEAGRLQIRLREDIAALPQESLALLADVVPRRRRRHVELAWSQPGVCEAGVPRADREYDLLTALAELESDRPETQGIARIRDQTQQHAWADRAKSPCTHSGGRGELEFRDGMEEWYVRCPGCGVRWMGGSESPLPAHDHPRD